MTFRELQEYRKEKRRKRDADRKFRNYWQAKMKAEPRIFEIKIAKLESVIKSASLKIESLEQQKEKFQKLTTTDKKER